MNYYKFHIGDYRRDTMHLSMIEHGAYRQLLDWYYLDERPIPKETQVVFRRLSAKTEEEKEAIKTVLKELFILGEDGYTQARTNIEISNYQSKAVTARKNGSLGGRPPKTQPVNDRLDKKTTSKANHKPLTINQEPLTNKKNKENKENKEKKGTRLQEGFVIPEEWEEFYFQERPDSNLNELELMAATFIDYWIAKPGKDGIKLNWFSTWRNWVRNDKKFNKNKDPKFDAVAYANRNNKENGKQTERDITCEVVRTD